MHLGFQKRKKSNFRLVAGQNKAGALIRPVQGVEKDGPHGFHGIGFGCCAGCGARDEESDR